MAIKISQEDELTIASLQQQAADSKTKEILANRNAAEAADMITSLNFEINQLRRKLKISEEKNGGATGGGGNSNEIYQMSYAAADAEVDAMLGNNNGFPPTKFVDKKVAESATPFERWKMNEFIFSPDTPAASEEYDRQVVQMLLEASTAEFNDDFRKPTKSGIAKMKRTNSLGNTLKPLTASTGSRLHLISTADGGANVYETVGVSVLDSLDFPPHSAVGGARRGQDEKIYYLDKAAPTAMWGGSSKPPQKSGSFGPANNISLREDLVSRGSVPGGLGSTAKMSPVRGDTRQDSNISPKRSTKAKGVNSMIV